MFVSKKKLTRARSFFINVFDYAIGKMLNKAKRILRFRNDGRCDTKTILKSVYGHRSLTLRMKNSHGSTFRNLWATTDKALHLVR